MEKPECGGWHKVTKHVLTPHKIFLYQITMFFRIKLMLLRLVACGFFLFTINVSFSQVPRFAYVANAYDNTLSIYTVDAKSGSLRFNGHAITGKFPSSVLVHPSQKFVYVSAQTGMGISAFKVNPDNGRLTELAGSPFSPEVVSPFWMVSDPGGRYLYVAARNSNNVAVMEVDKNSGSLTEIKGSPYPGGNLPRSITMDTTGKFVYMTSITEDKVYGYNVNPSSGGLIPLKDSPYEAGDAPQFIRVSPSGDFAYLTDWNSQDLKVYRINQKKGSLEGSSVYHLNDNEYPFGLTIHPTGKFIYVANWENSILGLKADLDTGRLTPVPGSPYKSKGVIPVQIEVEPTGKFAYATNYGSDNVTAYIIDPETGALTESKTITARAGPRSIAFVVGDKPVEYLPQFAFVLNSASSSVSVFGVDKATGRLKFINKAKTGKRPLSLSTDPSGDFLYVTNSGSDTISAFKIDTTGELQEIPASPFNAGGQPSAIHVDYNGRYVYVINKGSKNMSVYEMESTTGFLKEIPKSNLYNASPYFIGPDPTDIFLHPSERFAYSLSTKEKSIIALEFYGHGPLAIKYRTSEFPITVGKKPVSMAFDPIGKFAYVIDAGTNKLESYSVSFKKGFNSLGAPLETGKDPVGIDITPNGKYIYVVNRKSNNISTYRNSGKDNGFLKQVNSKVKTGKNPSGIKIDPSGKFAYVVNEGSDDVSMYSINQNTGELSSIGKTKVDSKPVAMVITEFIH